MWRAIGVMVLVAASAGCSKLGPEEGCDYVPMPVALDFFDSKGESPGTLFARNGGPWRASLTWARPPSGDVTTNAPAGATTILSFELSRPRSGRQVVGRNAGNTDLGCASYLDVEVDLDLATADGWLAEQRPVRLVAAEPKARVQVDFMELPPTGMLRADASPGTGHKLSRFDFNVQFGSPPDATLGVHLEKRDQNAISQSALMKIADIGPFERAK